MAKKPKTSLDKDKLFPLLIESIDHMKLTPSKREFALAGRFWSPADAATIFGASPR